MSLIDTPYGLVPVRHRFGGEIRPFTRRNAIASAYNTSIFIGDPVKALTDGTFALAAAGDAVSAIFCGWKPEDPGVYNVGRQWVANASYSKSAEFQFYAAHEFMFSVQANGSLAFTSLGDAADHVAGAGNTRSGQSTLWLSSTLVGAGNSAQWKVVDLDRDTQNNWGDAFTKVLVIANELNLGLVTGNAI